MIDVAALSEAEMENLEEKRANHMGAWICERRSKNPIVNELRFNHRFVYLGDSLFGQEGNEFELKVYDARKRIHIAFIGVGKDRRREGIGTRMMETITGLADKYGYTLDLDVDPKFGVKKEILIAFYEKFGFVKAGGAGKAYERAPQTKIERKEGEIA